jgi:hypothetical protein
MESVEADGEIDAGVSPLHVGVGPHHPVPPAAFVRRKGAAHVNDSWLYPGPPTCLALGLGDGRRLCLGDLRPPHGLIITAVTAVRRGSPTTRLDNNKSVRYSEQVCSVVNAHCGTTVVVGQCIRDPDRSCLWHVLRKADPDTLRYRIWVLWVRRCTPVRTLMVP